MGSLTISVDDQVLGRARARAVEQGTTVEAVLREHLTAFAGAGDMQARALAELVQLSAAATSRRGVSSWSRSELHGRTVP
jgi:hypothetical protein